MTTWGPEVGDHEVLTFGGEPSPRRPLRLLTAVAAAGLVAGFLAGGGAESAPDRATTTGQDRLAAGVVRPSTRGEHPFEVPVHNGTGEDVHVRVVGIPDWGVPVEPSADVEIPAGAWAAVRFTPGVDCSSPPFAVRSIAVRTRSSTGVLRTELGLATPSAELHDHHVVECARISTLTPARLSGVWILDETDAEQSWLSDRLLIRFGDGGQLVWDAEGRLFEALPGNRGRYRIGQGRLHLRITGGTACAPGDTFTWWTRTLPDDRVHLELARSTGSCSGRPQAVWVLRRILRDPPLPW